MAQRQLGRYQLKSLLGQGGMGAVWEAYDSVLGRRVAIKTIDSAADTITVRERLSREARFTGLFSHPNIVSVYDYGEEEETAFIVMEFLSGMTLEAKLLSTDMPWSRFLPVLFPCAAALDYAHALGVLHGDVKPANIFIQNDGPPKLLDFGLAQIAYGNIRTSAIMGTPAYMPPEILRGEPAGPTSDQYMLGVVVYRLLTGDFPFAFGNLKTFTDRVLGEEPASARLLIPSVSARAARAVTRALAKDPQARFSTCSDFLNELSEYVPVTLTQFGTRPSLSQEPTRALPARARFPGRLLFLFGQFLRPLFRRRLSSSRRPESQQRSVQLDTVERPTLPNDARPQIDVGLDAGTDWYAQQTQEFRGPLDTKVSALVLARRQADELVEAAERGDFSPVATLQGRWLPGVEGANPILLSFREAARYLMAAQNASTARFTVEHLLRAEDALASTKYHLAKGEQSLAQEFTRVVDSWTSVITSGLEEGRKRIGLELPNPFRAGQPLRPDQGRAVFRGRDQVVQQIESILLDTQHGGSVALLGPRRCGKTSLLQMLPALLPDCVCIFFDLQDNPADSTKTFFQALDRQAREQARRDRRIELPALPDTAEFSAAAQWFQSLDQIEGDFRILICVDEFERLEDLFPGDRQDLLRLMGLFRATIQHRRKLRLLVSGVAPFDELGPLWNDHFINVRQIRVGHLDRHVANDLLTRPLPDFPLQAIPWEVADAIFERTGGQPYLIQLYGSLLINKLNAEGRRSAWTGDIQPVEQEAMSQGAYYFRHTYESAPPPARKILEELAVGRKPSIPGPVREWLRRRGLISDAEAFLIPVLGTFMQNELGLI